MIIYNEKFFGNLSQGEALRKEFDLANKYSQPVLNFISISRYLFIIVIFIVLIMLMIGFFTERFLKW